LGGGGAGGGGAGSSLTDPLTSPSVARGVTADGNGLVEITWVRGAVAGIGPGVGLATDTYITAADGTVRYKPVGSSVSPTRVSDGVLASAAAPVWTGEGLYAFGEGTDAHLWYARRLGTLWGAWTELDGPPVTARPAVASLGHGEMTVFVRDSDGSVSQRSYTPAAGWGPWQDIGGHLLPGTGPTAAVLDGRIYVGVVGTNDEMFLKIADQPGGFFPIGGVTTADPALTPVHSGTALVAFIRGTNREGLYSYYTPSAGATPFTSMGGLLASGLAAATRPDGGTYTVGTGTDGRIYYDYATWSGPTPTFSGWQPDQRPIP
jgi:hypothetical protein